MNKMDLFIYLGIALLLSLLSSKAIKKFHMPNVTAYLIMGLIAGPYMLKLISHEAVASFEPISEIALGFIAFSIGSEFKFSYLKKVGKAPVVIAVFEAFMAVILVDAALILTGHDLSFSLMLGAIAAATAPAATLMVVRQYKSKGPVTNTLMPVVAIDDAIALMLFGISLAIVKTISATEEVSLLMTLLKPFMDIAGALILGAFMGMIMTYLIKWFTGRGNRLSVTIAMVAVTLGLSKYLGLSELLSCMAMSAIFVNFSSTANSVFEQVERFTPPIFMMFFFVSGADLNIAILPSVGVVGLIYVVVRVIGKASGATLGATLCKCEEPVRKYLGFTLIPQAGVAIGLASVAMNILPEYGQTIKVIILAATVIYELVGPVATKIALTKAGDIKPVLDKEFSTVA